MNIRSIASSSAIALLLALTGCAATYEAPRAATPSPATAKFNKTKPELMKIVRRQLIAEGIQVINSDDASGTLTTMSLDFRLTPDLADCGTTMGLDYLKDNRTSSKVAYGLVVDDGTIAVRAVLQSEYKPGAVDQNITLTCVSRGVLEQRLLQKFAEAHAAK